MQVEMSVQINVFGTKHYRMLGLRVVIDLKSIYEKCLLTFSNVVRVSLFVTLAYYK